MDKIISKDGTPIAYQRSGAGAPLVLVHGTGGAYARWRPVLPALEKQFTVYAVDRRGRGDSGEAQSYAIEREFEDVAAVVDSIGDGVNLLGHSFGAICALEAALLTPHVRKLLLYEPPLPIPGVPIYPEGVIDRLQDLLDAGDRPGVLTTFMSEVVRMPAHELELFQSTPAFPARVAAAHTLPRELRAHEAYRFEPERFKNLNVPTLLMLGGDSPPFFKAAIEAANAALPNSRVVVLLGQQHIAIDTAPDLFVHEVVAFLSEPG
ncbi:MAG: alpha/beta hydrolase [Candidatus Methanoperedens sp.]|nr:alpha/beta hydrolase [Candidatus Methanoperedens sp.]